MASFQGPDISDLLARLNQLASFPDVALRLDEMVGDPNCDAGSFAEVIQADPGLAASLLRLANSAAYGGARQVDDIRVAVLTVGTQVIRDLAYSVCVVNAFEDLDSDLMTHEEFWSHSLYTGLLAETLKKHFGIRTRESLFASGLLHDIGQLAMYSLEPERSRQVLTSALERTNPSMLHEEEKRWFGFDHAELGAEIALGWQFPPNLVAAIRDHHDAAAMQDAPDGVVLIHIANSLAVLAELNSTDLVDCPALAPAAALRFPLNPELIGQLIADAAERHDEVLQVLLG